MQARERRAGQAGQFFDSHYSDLLADPLACVRRMYEHFDLDLTDRTAQRMRRFLAEHSQHKHGVHRYTPETFGIDPARDVRHFEDYCDRYGFVKDVKVVKVVKTVAKTRG
jgi:lipopolysaccharide biosynthesis protein